jgi:hypothetical protein
MTSYSDEQLMAMTTRVEVLKLKPADRLRWFKLFLADHRISLTIQEDISTLLNPNHPCRIIFLVGATGAGKTKMLLHIVQNLMLRRWGDIGETEIPYAFVEAPSNGTSYFCWLTLWTDILTILHDVIKGKKINPSLEIHESDTAGTRIGIHRNAVVRHLILRNTRVLVIDEGMHIFRVSDPTMLMDSLKSLSDASPAKLIIAAAYDVLVSFERINDCGQVYNRARFLHYERYKIGNNADRLEFKRCLETFLAVWPCEEVPNLSPIALHLMKSTLGSIGSLKNMLTAVLQAQLKAKDRRFDPSFLVKAEPSRAAALAFEKTMVAGEEAIAPFLQGSNTFGDKAILDELTRLMAATT